MTEADQKRLRQAQELRTMRDMPGFAILRDELNSRIKFGWEEFIKLQPEKKTQKLAMHYQAQYLVFKEILEFVDDGIRVGDQIERAERKRFEATPQPEVAGA